MTNSERSSASAYAAAGVDRSRAAEAIARMKAHARSTFTPNVLADIGLFGGLFALDKEQYQEPVLVATTDSVGTKLKVAFMMNKHDTVGIDIVSHCANDVLAQGAQPLFFLDYIGTSQLDPEVMATVVAGIAEGCKQAGCALIGGETAELPGFYNAGEYDLVGMMVGVVEKSRLIDGRDIKVGDRVIGLLSSGLHTNGYSLARKLLFEVAGYTPDTVLPELGCTIGEELLKPHRCYVKPVLSLLNDPSIPQFPPCPVKGIAHITGGGLIENVPRILPPGCKASIGRGSWCEPEIFGVLQRLGNVPTEEMFRVFNMGIGLVLIVDAQHAPRMASQLMRSSGIPAPIIGRIDATDGAPTCEIVEV
ncbi:MAG: phosphoribosylformylglycinamidine cyclo-ligase [Abditibacteriales bacterium]|nr:phosphoribosylformylglycinamidine cyclo-ligase [Abditibacteriales bacterium]MDW8365117.1 phosphoribosylformylglycinamidine cyclo-ligase [Abditibacteriales bacterium]